MNTVFIIALVLYMIMCIGVAAFDFRKIDGFDDYVAAGKKQSTFAVVMTLMATVLGASTTIGITDTVYSIGFPGIWWLLFATVGFLLQGILISEKVRDTGVVTLPQLAEVMAGTAASVIIALVIVISWVGVIAGQIVALSSLISFATGFTGKLVTIVVSLVIVVYTMVGGQLSVVKTDKLQLILIVIGVFGCFAYLYGVKGTSGTEIEFVNENFGARELITNLFVIGGVYLLGPDVMSRNFIAKDAKTAKKSAFVAAAFVGVFAFLIAMIGLWARTNIPAEELGSSKALLYVAGLLPKPLTLLLVFGLFSAIISSTDTCIINASSIFVKNIIKKENVNYVRITVLVMGVAATVIATAGSGNIISLLTSAYSIYTPGIIFPMLIAILAYKKRPIRRKVWLTGVITGGICGIATCFSGFIGSLGLPEFITSNLTLVGMGLSLFISLISLF